MAGWEDYNITGSNFGNRVPYPILDAFISALQEKFLAIPLSSYDNSFTPYNWRAKFQVELNKVLRFYVPYYEDTQNVFLWQIFLTIYGFLDGKTDGEIEVFLETLCNTGSLTIPIPEIFLADYAEMIYDLLNLMTNIRADKIPGCFKINYTTDVSGEWHNTEGESDSWTEPPFAVTNRNFNPDYFYYFPVGTYFMYRYPWPTANQLYTRSSTENCYDIKLKFTNPTYSAGVKFSYDITGFFSGENDYTKTKKITHSGYKYPYLDGYKKYESDYTISTASEGIDEFCSSDISEVLISTGLTASSGNLNEDSTLPPVLAPYPTWLYLSYSGNPPSEFGAPPYVQDGNGYWYLPPEINLAWCDDDNNEHYYYDHSVGFTKPVIYVSPSFDFHV